MRARIFPSLLLGAALLASAAPASAFCRSTSCTGDCPRDDDGCKTTGAPLSWPGVCVGFSLQKDGTQNLDMEAVRRVLEDSFAAWSDRACQGGSASIAFAELDDVSCHATEYNPHGPNANLILFQDNRWTYHGPNDTLAKTTVTFDNGSGEIFDADIEVNHAYNEFTIGDDNVVYDLQSVLTHEIGHFIGIDHAADFDATMYAGYDEGTTSLRTLESDDIDALCTVYPAGRAGKCDPTPRGGLGDACGQEHADDGTSKGCSFGARGEAPGGAIALLLLPLILRRSRRRRGSTPGR
jgi:hypothetical protein